MKKLLFHIGFIISVLYLMSSCTADQPVIPTQRELNPETTNPSFRTTSEAIEIAEEAFMNFYGVNTNSALRGRSSCDVANVKVLPKYHDARSQCADSLLYVVELPETDGFALIAINKANTPLIGISNEGTYDEAVQSVPAFQFWIETTIEALSAKGSEEIASRGDDFVEIWKDDKLMGKEWNDTISKRVKLPMVRNSWGQGPNTNTNKSINYHPEGYYFEYGLCGCAPLALAEAGLAIGKPQTVYMNGVNKGEILSLDWEKLREHKKWKSDASETATTCDNVYEVRMEIHEIVAKLCRATANYCDAVEVPGATSVSSSNLAYAATKFFGYNNLLTYNSYNGHQHPENNTVFIFIGISKYEPTSGHAWLCDGFKIFKYIHYYATRTSQFDEWQIQTAETQFDEFNHFNWGWDGKANGWFATIEPSGSVSTGITTSKNFCYTNLQYLVIE